MKRHVVKHGTVNEYQNYGCRCDACREVAMAYIMNRKRCEKCGGPRSPRKGQRFCQSCSPHFQETHGIAGYKRRHCRCDVCRAAAAAQKRRQRANNLEHYRHLWREQKRRKRAAA